jgi:hypothetical protein
MYNEIKKLKPLIKSAFLCKVLKKFFEEVFIFKRTYIIPIIGKVKFNIFK